jgi:outer membrane protein assembly factor BamE (lipoprotein component of BamABCDE complex)
MTGILKKILSVALLVLIFGCSEQYRNHGYIPSDEELSSVSVSQDDKNSVIEKLGTPSIGGILNDGNIYFVQSKVLKNSIRASKPIDRQVLVLSFDDNDRLSNIQKFGISVISKCWRPLCRVLTTINKDWFDLHKPVLTPF